MEDPVLEVIKHFVVVQLQSNYGYCGVMNSKNLAILNSSNGAGKDIEITIKAEDE